MPCELNTESYAVRQRMWQVIELLQARPSTHFDLAEPLGLQWKTADHYCQTLVKMGVLEKERGQRSGARGQPRSVYRVVNTAKMPPLGEYVAPKQRSYRRPSKREDYAVGPARRDPLTAAFFGPV